MKLQKFKFNFTHARTQVRVISCYSVRKPLHRDLNFLTARRHVFGANIVVTATGVPGVITSQMLQPGAVVVDAGTAAEHGKIVGGLAADVRERSDLTITPEKGGVGPLTVTALFDNVIQAAKATVED